VNENAWKTKWVPAIAVGAIGRTGIQLGGSVGLPYGVSANNADCRLVCSDLQRREKPTVMLLAVGS
jgi:hypothetical protein